MGVSRFQDLVAWQLSLELCRLVFELTADGPAAVDEKFRTQMRDAAQSAPALIAEGFLRFTPAEFIRYLRMARGEIGEIQSNLLVGSAARYFSATDPGPAVDLANRAMATTTALLKSKLKQQAVAQRAKRDQRQARRQKRRSPGSRK